MASSIRRETAWLVVGDLALLVVSLLVALTIRNLAFPSPGYFFDHFIAFAPVFLISLFVFFVAGLYEKQTRLIRGVMGGRILGAQVGSVLIAAVLFFFLPLSLAPKTVLALYLAVSVLLISGWRFAAIPRFRVRTREHAVLIGSGNAATEMYEEVNGNPRYFFRFVLHVEPKEEPRLRARIEAALQEGARLFIIDTRDAAVRAELPRLYDPMLSGATFVEFATFFEDVFDRVPLAHIDHAWILECLPKRHIAYDVGKRVYDVVGALLGLIVALPLVVPAALILSFSGAPFIFHERVGRAGTRFRVMKLRTMLFDDHGHSERQKQNRVTTVGAFLRKTRIDELPQLVNILIGDLSFIGPRPELPTLVEQYERAIPYYGVRHLITPGLSGWAQIWDYDAPKGGVDIERTARKLSYDLYYLKRRSFVLDLIISLKTVRALASFSGK